MGEGGQSIPVNLDLITAQWMTDALAASHPGAVVSEVKVVLRDDGTNRRARLGLTYSAGSGPDTVFVKAVDPAHAELTAATSGLFHEPRLFLSGMALPVDHPAVHLSLIDEPGQNFIMVMEDLSARGADPRDSTRPLTPAQAAAGMRALARLHSTFWNTRLTERAALSWVELYTPWPEEMDELMAGVIPLAFDMAGDAVPGPVRAYRPMDLILLWKSYVRTLATGPQTLLHGDAHIGNTYVLPGDDIGFLDWQMLRRGHWSLDVGYFLQGAVTTEDRRAHEAELIEVYRTSLDVPEEERPTAEQAWTSYRASTVYGLVLWLATLTGSAWQREDISLALTQRYADAFNDLDAPTAIPAP
ncbi:aminoglycoside phosphotransferase (APT) family kinase protein [Actinocorallia herbida]|uniref:Aminoglycoside phosphotransferase (APT) family kinase protein n=1 Tax=Actinocorallia herbida TaxID=58109 RepID=A0A3N1D1W8_9ACTN|nr:phosphotransferase [Actinocorallia herbida]ROO87537.1 aminoglycoside phosphotransferase (APT) family kinase protein [Actinocorallia herbida]